MINRLVKKVMGAATLITLSITLLTGCGQEKGQNSENTRQRISDTVEGPNIETEAETGSGVLELEVRFGDNGAPFRMQLLDNETAAAIARYVGTSDWRLPIYERDGDADYNVMQYYDISSRYDIPSNPETVTSEKAGQVYYSDPNRIVLFYHDAEITGEYTQIGTFDATEDFVNAVEENPVLEGWGNKIVQITQP